MVGLDCPRLLVVSEAVGSADSESLAEESVSSVDVLSVSSVVMFMVGLYTVACLNVSELLAPQRKVMKVVSYVVVDPVVEPEAQ